MELLVFAGCFVIVSAAATQIGSRLTLTGLPLISGFLLTGIIAGPYLLDLIPKESIRHLRFVDEFSLGFIAFAAGSELHLKELKPRLKPIALVTTGLVVSTFFLTSVSMYLLSNHIPFMTHLAVPGKIAVSIMAGAIMVARSPSSAIAIVNELRAKGAFTQTVLGVTVIMDVVVIVLFSTNSGIAGALLSGLQFNPEFILLLLLELFASGVAGFLIFKVIQLVLIIPVPDTLKSGLILVTGYMAFWCALQFRHLTQVHLPFEILMEPLLICMIAGFLISNNPRFREDFSARLFPMGPAVYVLFFTLTGASLSLDILMRTWPLALTLFFVRAGAVFLGSFAGNTLAGAPLKDAAISGMAFITQAGVGLGLAKEVASEFPEWGDPFATVIIAIIVLNQLVGPPLFKWVIKLMREDHSRADAPASLEVKQAVVFGSDGQAHTLCASLASQGWQVTLTGTHPPENGTDSEDIRRICLEDLSPPQLRKAGCHHAGAIVAMVSDEDNFKICETAYEQFGTRTLVARLNHRSNFKNFQALGVLIVDPATAIVSLMDHFVRSPAAASMLMGMHRERRLEDIVLKNPHLAGMALGDLRLPLNTVVLSVRRRGVLFVPHAFTRLEAGDRVTMVGSEEALKEVGLHFGIHHEQALIGMVERASAPEIVAPGARPRIRAAIKTRPGKKRLDELIATCPVLDLKYPMDKHQLFKQVSHAMAKELKVAPEVLNQLLIKRETEMSTVLAPGLAVPHVIIEGENISSMLIARNRQGIEFDTSMPGVTAVFVLAGTRDERKFHLTALSTIARMALSPRFEQKWMRARSTRALRDLILRADDLDEPHHAREILANG